MKTKLLSALLVGMLFTVSIFANDPETTTYSNIQNTETGSVKEFTTFSKSTNEPMQKSTYRYDLAGNIQEKVVYKWNGDKGWVGAQKLEYKYNETATDRPVGINFSEWDSKKNDWTAKQKSITFEYKTDGSSAVDVKAN